MLAFKGQFAAFGVAAVLMVVTTIASTAAAFTVQVLSVLPPLRAGLVLLVVLPLMPPGFGTSPLFE